jgi:hypothetical protein
MPLPYNLATLLEWRAPAALLWQYGAACFIWCPSASVRNELGRAADCFTSVVAAAAFSSSSPRVVSGLNAGYLVDAKLMLHC